MYVKCSPPQQDVVAETKSANFFSSLASTLPLSHSATLPAFLVV